MLPEITLGQSSTVSPYSSYGIGSLQNTTGAQGFAMGQTGNALHNDSLSPYYVNLKNPASYFYNRNTTFEAGLLNSNVTLSSQSISHTTHNTYFGYFAVAFPVPRSKWASACLGIRPMSNVGYSINTTTPIDSIAPNGQIFTVDNANTQYIGSGGLNNAFLGLAFGLGKRKRLSIGANISYLFGNITNVQNLTLPSNYNTFNTEKAQNTNVKSFYFNYGIMYTIGKDSGWHVTLGLTAAMPYNVKASYNLLAINYYNGIVYDTVQDSNRNGYIRLPLSLGGGVAFQYGTQWTFSLDYNMQNWSQYTFFGQPEQLNNSSLWAFGVQYVPKKGSDGPHTYFKNVNYRAGFSYSTTYLNLNNTSLKDYNVSLGVAFPIGKDVLMHRISVLNIGVQAGQMGTTSNNLLRERYLKVFFGFTFNDRWFQKREFQ